MKSRALIAGAVERLSRAFGGRGPVRLFAGPDGFVDEIVDVVDKRMDAERYVPVRTIREYATRLAEAAGKSTNVEFVVRQVKAGGNGPLMSEAFGRLGGRVTYIGCVGENGLNPLFAGLEEYGEVIAIAPAAVTLAAEFEDGKIMHGKHDSLRLVTWENLLKGCGGDAALDRLLGEADVAALLNWTMLPFLTDIFRGIRSHLGRPGAKPPRFLFFDLCDPAKRTVADIREALSEIGGFSPAVQNVVLGLNEKESVEVCSALDIDSGDSTSASLLRRAELIAGRTGVTEVVIHPTGSAVAWSRVGTGVVDGPFCAAPRLTTGAGDHFNGGYMFARALGLAPSDAVVVGVCVSGFYVRECRGPSVAEIIDFARRWAAGELDS